jgi:hypothetical protein
MAIAMLSNGPSESFGWWEMLLSRVQTSVKAGVHWNLPAAAHSNPPQHTKPTSPLQHTTRAAYLLHVHTRPTATFSASHSARTPANSPQVAACPAPIARPRLPSATPLDIQRRPTLHTRRADSAKAPLRRNARMSNADFLGRAIETVKKAIEIDTAGDYKKAYAMYDSALELFLLALKCAHSSRHGICAF